MTWSYDGADRMVGRSADGVSVTYAYDANGNRTGATGPAGTITATYDRLNRPLTTTAEDGSTTTLAYDFESPPRTDPSGTYAFNLDAFGREIGISTPLYAGEPFSFGYRADGQPAQRIDPNGNRTGLAYDPLGRLTAKTTTGSGGTPNRAAYSYSYNAAG